jgi:hypothetical protein
MKTTLLSFSFLFSTFLFSQNKPYDEVAAIKEVIQEAYVDGIFNEGYMRSIDLSFSDHFESIGLLENDETVVETISQWKEMVRSRKQQGYYPVPPSDHVTVKYLHVEVSRTVANVKLEFLVGGVPKYIDFLALYKFSGGWKIVNRTYHAIDEADRKKTKN